MPYYMVPPPKDPAQLEKYLLDELTRIQEILNGYQELLQLGKTNVAPSRPRNGHMYYADGVNWNPGSGEGVYAYYNGTWNKAA